MKALIGSSQRRRKSLSSGVVILALLFLGVVAAGAHAHGGGKPQFVNTPSGPYLLSAWTDPDPWRVDEAHVIVGVSDPATREPIVTGVIVRVRLQSIADPSIVLEQIAGTDNVNRLFYAAEFNHQITEGRWRAFVSASGDMGEGEEIVFEIEAEPARGVNWLWIGIGGMGVFIVGWLVLSMRYSPPAKPASRQRRQNPVKEHGSPS